MQWQLFIRHAHRDTENRRLDNGLSNKGRRQCQELVDYLSELRVPRIPVQIISSPMRRCLETADAVSKWAKIPVEVDERLEEQRKNEKDLHFYARIQNFFYDYEVKSRICIVSHGDVLPLFARLAGTSIDDIKKGDLFWLENKILRGLNDVANSKAS